MNLTGIPTDFSLAEANTVLLPLFLFIIGMTIYAIYVFIFYRFLSQKNLFSLDLHQYSHPFSGFMKNFTHSLLYILEYLILLPIFNIFWVGVISLMILVLAKNQDINNILLVSMALVATVRITSYYHEQLSQDVAKLLPFVLLGVFLLDISFFSLDNVITSLKSIPSLWKLLAYYFAFTVSLELFLRISLRIYHTINPPEE